MIKKFFLNFFGNWIKVDGKVSFEFSIKKQAFVFASACALLWPPVSVCILVNIAIGPVEVNTENLKEFFESVKLILEPMVDYFKAILIYYGAVIPVILGGYIGGKWIDSRTDGSSNEDLLRSDE